MEGRIGNIEQKEQMLPIQQVIRWVPCILFHHNLVCPQSISKPQRPLIHFTLQHFPNCFKVCSLSSLNLPICLGVIRRYLNNWNFIFPGQLINCSLKFCSVITGKLKDAPEMAHYVKKEFSNSRCSELTKHSSLYPSSKIIHDIDYIFPATTPSRHMNGIGIKML